MFKLAFFMTFAAVKISSIYNDHALPYVNTIRIIYDDTADDINIYLTRTEFNGHLHRFFVDTHLALGLLK